MKLQCTAIKCNDSLKYLQRNKIVLYKQYTELPRELGSFVIGPGKKNGDFENKKSLKKIKDKL